VELGAQGVAFTYNEPVISLEWVLDVAGAARAEGLYTVMVTNGYVTAEGLDLFASCIDVWRVDVKAFGETPFRHLCKVPHPEIVREQAVRAKKVHGMHVECVTNVVPTVNDSDEELGAIAHWIATELGPDTVWQVTRFIPYLEFANLEATPIDTLERARRIGIAEGLRFVYLGNVDVPGAEDTICPACGERVVVRRGYDATVSGVGRHGTCAAFGTGLGMVVADEE
jgi:pyruvate formate lyase activating enzyme